MQPTKNYGVSDEQTAAEHKVDALLLQKFLVLVFAVISLGLVGSAYQTGFPPKATFLLAISVILSALTFCWLLLLPASLRGIHGSWHTPDIPWECWIVPASLMYDPLFGVLAFGAATAAAPQVGSGYAYSLLAGATAMMFLASCTLLFGLVYLAYTEYMKGEHRGHLQP